MMGWLRRRAACLWEWLYGSDPRTTQEAERAVRPDDEVSRMLDEGCPNDRPGDGP